MRLLLLAGVLCVVSFGCSGSKVCTPGQSIACVGPAGCSGGQSCKADGSGYDPCTCGGAGGGSAGTGGGSAAMGGGSGATGGGSAAMGGGSGATGGGSGATGGGAGGGQADAGNPCSNGTDCSICGNTNDCITCNMTKYDGGIALFNDLGNCVVCVACYTTCNGAQSSCPMPTGMDTCDVGSCGTCSPCSMASTGKCGSQKAACDANPDCSALYAGIRGC
jgi:hypothetical protein